MFNTVVYGSHGLKYKPYQVIELYKMYQTLLIWICTLLLCRWYDLVLEAADDIAHIMTAECGKPVKEAKGECVVG